MGCFSVILTFMLKCQNSYRDCKNNNDQDVKMFVIFGIS